MEKVKSDVIFPRNLVPLTAAKGLLVLRYFCWHQWGHLWSRLPFTPRKEDLAYLSAWKSEVQSHWLLREVDNHKCPWSQRELRVESKPRRFPGVPQLDLQEQLPVAIQSKEIKCWHLCRRIPNPIPQQMSTGLCGRLVFCINHKSFQFKCLILEHVTFMTFHRLQSDPAVPSWDDMCLSYNGGKASSLGRWIQKCSQPTCDSQEGVYYLVFLCYL